MKKIALMLLSIAFIGMLTVEAQVRRVTGTVTSADDGTPIPGVSVMVEGTTLGTITNIDGVYQLDVPNDATTLVFSFVGMTAKEVEITSGTLDIVLEQAYVGLDEVMVVAYGTAKKESFTGSAAVINEEKLQNRPVANVSKALDGLSPGIQATSGSGQPGSGSSIVIRGFGSINASTTPLYVVDGIPYNGNISAINPSDIASITVLKDASAGALYGARGANGVIMITTKRGESQKTTFNIKANWGLASRAIPRYETMGEAAWIETVFQSYKNHEIINNGISPDLAGAAAIQAMASGARAVFGDNEMYNPYNFSATELIDPVTGKVRPDATLRYSEDWLDEVTAENPLRQEYIFSASGGKDNTKYLFSLGYLNEEGLLETTKFERFTGRINVDTKSSDWFEAGLSTNLALSTSNTSATGASAYSNTFYTNQLMGPVFPIYEKDEEGNTVLDGLGNPVFDYGQSRPSGASSNFNSVATLYEDKYASNSDNVSGRTFMNFGDTDAGFLKGLKLSLNFGFDFVNAYGMTYYNPNFGNAASTKGRIARNNGRTFSYTFNQLVTWNKEIGKHNIDVLAGHENYSYKYNYLSGTKTGFPFGGLFELDAATSIVDAGSYENNYNIESYLSRINYDFDDKYYFSASFRTDGSSRFHKDYRWGQFWSAGANWRISEENFMAGFTWLDNFSLKASYGIQGNDAVGSFYAWQSFYDLGWPNAAMSGAAVSSLENTNLKWEENANFNTGLEARLFDRLNIAFEYYNKITEDMLLEYPIASSLGFDSYLKNIGSMRNTGFDMTLGGSLIRTSDFMWNLTLMGSTVKNEVLQLADKPEIITGNYIIKEGETLYSFYLSEAAGVDPATGAMVYRVYDTDDDDNKEYYLSTDPNMATASKEIMGSRIPDLHGSISNEISYKGFDLSVLTTYSIGGYVLDGVYRNLMYGWYVGQASHVNRGRAWKNPGDITDIPRLEIGKTYPTTNDDLIDASYFSIKNVTLGYSLPARYVQSLHLESVRFSLIGDNLKLFTHLKGMDPQYNFTGGTTFTYTPVRTISFGIDVKF
jgi:TonB-linked SusC/RagA family outer membrane protein